MTEELALLGFRFQKRSQKNRKPLYMMSFNTRELNYALSTLVANENRFARLSTLKPLKTEMSFILLPFNY